MEHSLARERYARQDDTIGALAIDFLAYAAMEDNDTLEAKTLETSGIDLGRVIVTWYQMCQAHRGAAEVAETARKTAQGFQADVDALTGPDSVKDQFNKNRCIALAMARGLLIDLATDKIQQFAELWETLVVGYDIPAITETLALMLGFTRGILDAPAGGQ